jgi:adenosylcobinamide-phosphate synthase
MLAALALLVENLVGYPDAIYRRIGHPVEWIGRLINVLEDQLNLPADEAQQQKMNGVLAVAALVIGVIIPAALLQWITLHLPFGWVVNVAFAIPFIAQKSLRDHVQAVADALASGESPLTSAPIAVGKIVGRDTTRLDESGICKAALESLAENTSDGIVAPALWYAVAGLPGLYFYKAVNTADSMIGHKSERYLHFGWAAARLDDLINLPASRISGLLFAAAAWFKSPEDAKRAWRSMWRDASKHGSPNAGWPEAAMAGALNLQFGGPRVYNGDLVDLPWMGDGVEAMSRADIARGLAIFERSMIMLAAGLFCLAAVL